MAIKQKLKKLIIDSIPGSIQNIIKYPSIEGTDLNIQNFINLSFSQEGEDLVLCKLIGEKKKGFYVDIGAHHPLRFSNTYKFYLNGWRGINIDPLPGSMDLFKKVRRNDINLEIPILKDTSASVVYYMFDEPALNTFSRELAESRSAETSYKIINKISIQPYTLQEILEKHLPENQEIDFLTIDVEGMDMEVLQSNNWKQFSPRFIVAESFSTVLYEDLTSPISNFLKDKGYEIVAKTANSLFYSRKENYRVVL